MKTQSGFSLPELMIAMGILGGITVITMKLIDDQAGNAAYLTAKTEIAKAISTIKTTMTDSSNCRSMFAGAVLDMTGATKTALGSANWTPTTLSIPLKTGGFKVFLKQNARYNGFETRTISVSKPVGTPENIAELEVLFRLKSRNTKLWDRVGITTDRDRFISEKVRFTVSTKTAGVTRITDCGGPVSESNDLSLEKFCKSLGTAVTWNNVTKKCIFNDLRCPYGQLVVKMTDFGTPVCDDIKKHINVFDLFDTISSCPNNTGRFKIIKVSNKLRISCL